jgi:hypothetical protein
MLRNDRLDMIMKLNFWIIQKSIFYLVQSYFGKEIFIPLKR